MAMSEFSGFNIGRQMFNTFQVAMNVTGHNIANASNPAYTRQRAVIQASLPMSSLAGVGNIGGGSQVVMIQRLRSTYVDAQRTNTQGNLGASTVLSQGLTQLQSLWNEGSGQGISTSVDALSSDLSTLSTQPDSLSLRQGVLDDAGALAQQIQQKYADLSNLQRQSDQQVGSAVDEINNLSSQVAQLNTEIAGQLAIGQQPNDLLDQRQAAVEKLGDLSGAQSALMDNGMINLNIGGHWLVSQDRAASISSSPDAARPGLTVFSWADNGQVFTPVAGEAQAGLELRDQDIPDAMAKLDSLAVNLMADYNGLQAGGYALNAAAPGGTQFFTGTGAQDIAVDPALAANPAALAAAGSPSAPGDGNQAAAMAALNGNPSPGLGQSYTDALATWASEAGSSAQLADQQHSTQQSLMTQLDSLTASISGVNINEEAINLSEYQQAYQAGAHYIAALDTMIQSLLSEIK